MEFTGSFTFMDTWRGQYNRMIRSYRKLYGVKPKNNIFDAGEIEDGYIHFFQDAWHLKDWLINDPSLNNLIKKKDFQKYVELNQALKLTADLANGSKHLVLDRITQTGDITTNMKQGNFSGDPTEGLKLLLQIESNGKIYDALDLANELIKVWDEYLKLNGLEPKIKAL